jgi:hypothetical protein
MVSARFRLGMYGLELGGLPFENDLDRLSRLSRRQSRDHCYWGISTRPWKSVDNEAAHNEAANEKDLPLPHIKCKSAFGRDIDWTPG